MVEKGEERRERREERREKKAQKRPPKLPNEAARGGATLFLAMPPCGGTSDGFKGRGRRAEKREKREDTRENMFFSCFS